MIAEAETRADRASTGVDGLDRILEGGLPRGRSTLLAGTAGSGKTVLALQTLVTGVTEQDEPGIFVTFEESADQLRSNAEAFGWDVSDLEPDQLFLLEARLGPDTVQAGEFDFQAMLAGLGSKAEDMGARRVVFDGIDMLLDLLHDPAAQRREMHRLDEWLERAGLTGIITFKGGAGEAGRPIRYGFMEYLVDAVVLLANRMTDRQAVRSVRVLKYRGSAHREGEFPMVIGPEGMEVVTFDPHLRHPRSSDRVGTGVTRLDHMLGGGYFQGSTVLVSGASGAAKTTLAGAYAAAACKAGERVLFVSFDEAADQIVRNLSSVGLDLDGCTEAGTLMIHSTRTEARSAESHLIELRRLIRDFDPEHLVVDPLSAFGKAGGHVTAVHAALRLLDFAKSRGITSLVTSLVPDGEVSVEQTPLEVSTIADTWIHLEYLVRDGERNRTITIVKARGTGHSNQVRELILTDHGIDLDDVYVEDGQVLVGTARWVREQEAGAERRGLERRVERERRAAALAEAEVQNRIERLELEREVHEEQLADLLDDEERRVRRLQETRAGIHSRRRGDGPGPVMAGADVAGMAADE